MKRVDIPQHVIRDTADFLQREHFDTDAVKEDVNEQSVQNKECSLALQIEHAPLPQAILTFIQKAKGTLYLQFRFCSCNGVISSLSQHPALHSVSDSVSRTGERLRGTNTSMASRKIQLSISIIPNSKTSKKNCYNLGTVI